MKQLRKAMLILCLVTVIFSSATALAADSMVTYDGDVKRFVFLPDDTDLFSGFKSVMPGDALEQRIKIKTNVPKNQAVKIYLRAEPASEQGRNFLSQMTLTVAQEGKSALFSAPASEQGTIADNACLGTFYSGANIDLIVGLNVPIEMGNEFQDNMGVINWVFSAEQFALNPSLPKTGDVSGIANMMLISAFFTGSVGLVLFLKLRIKQQH